MSDRARGHDDGQLPPQVYRRLYKAQFARGAADVAMLSAGDKGSCWIDSDRSRMQVALSLSQPFITEPWIRAQRMERKIVRSSHQFDFMNVDRVAAVPHQDLLS